MIPAYSDQTVTLWHGDCLDVLRELPDCSVDSVCTDPPYGLEFMGKEWDSFKGANDWGRLGDTTPWTERPKGGTDPFQGDRPRFHAGRPFQQWCELWAAECLRVLKPGGHLLAFGGSRTWHRLASAVEDAGFEIRDSIAWLYGSGFPKSLDVSKAIDKRRTEDLEPVRVICRAIRAAMDVRDLRSRHLVEHFDGCHPRLIDHWAARDTDSQPNLPTWEQWETLTGLFPELAEHDAEAWRLNGRKGLPGEAWDSREITGTVEQWADRTNYALTSRDGLRRDAPATPAAEQWQGWGTALKPAFEPIVVARKPLTGTVASNVTTWGTGALNIDGCRVGLGDGEDRAKLAARSGGAGEKFGRGIYQDGMENDGGGWKIAPAGRWPANVVLDESQAEALDQQSGTLTSGANPTRRGSDKFREAYGDFKGQEECTPARGVDVGGASRFFFIAREDNNPCPSTSAASTATSPSHLPSAPAVSAPSDAATSAHPDTEKLTDSPSTSATPNASNPSDASSTPTTTSTESESSHDWQPGEPSQWVSRARYAASLTPTDTTTTTTSPSTSDGSADPATSSTTPNSVPGVPLDALAERFMYVAKADASERPRVNGISHPTVKPLSLARWLVRLVTPPGGTVLEPFAGSGTTVEACIVEGFRCIAIEREADYLPLIEARITRRRDPVRAIELAGEDLGLFGIEDVS